MLKAGKIISLQNGGNLGAVGKAGPNSVPGLGKDPHLQPSQHDRRRQGHGGRPRLWPGQLEQGAWKLPRPTLGQCRPPGAVCERTERGQDRPEGLEQLHVFPSSPGSHRAACAGQGNRRDWGEGWPQGNFFYFRWKYGSRFLIFTLCGVKAYFILAAGWLIVAFDIQQSNKKQARFCPSPVSI